VASAARQHALMVEQGAARTSGRHAVSCGVAWFHAVANQGAARPSGSGSGALSLPLCTLWAHVATSPKLPAKPLRRKIVHRVDK
jgi:hypothetical protein